MSRRAPGCTSLSDGREVRRTVHALPAPVVGALVRRDDRPIRRLLPHEGARDSGDRSVCAGVCCMGLRALHI